MDQEHSVYGTLESRDLVRHQHRRLQYRTRNSSTATPTSPRLGACRGPPAAYTIPVSSALLLDRADPSDNLI